MELSSIPCLNDPASLEVVNSYGVRFTCPNWWVNLLMPCKDRTHIIVEDLHTHNPNSETEDVLITRYRGGLGDQICMIPAVKGLLERHGGRLHLAVPALYFPLFEHLGLQTPLIDTEVEEQSGGYYRFRLHYQDVYDFYCPAGRYERSVSYDVQKSRVENFCEHVGVPVKAPHIIPKKVSHIFAGLKRPIVGFAPRAASWTKEWPISWVVELARKFEKRGWTLVCFDNLFTFDTIPSIFGMNLTELGDILSQLDFMVAVDSGVMHYALAVGIPTLGLFGPTSGYHTMKVYPNGFYIQSFTEDKCLRPCYYSTRFRQAYCSQEKGEQIKGGIKRGIYSTCMREISVDAVDSYAAELLGRT